MDSKVKRIFLVIVTAILTGCSGSQTLKSYSALESLSENKYQVDVIPEKGENRVGSIDQVLFTVTVNKNKPNYFYSPVNFYIEPDFPTYGNLIVKKGSHKVAGYFTISGENMPVIQLPMSTGHRLLIPIELDGSFYHKAYNNGGNNYDLNYSAVLGNWRPSDDIKLHQMKNSFYEHDQFSIVYRGRDGDFLYFESQNLKNGLVKKIHTNARQGVYDLSFVKMQVNEVDGDKIKYTVL